MLATVLWFDKENGIGVVRTDEGQEHHISADMMQAMEQDSVGMLKPGMVVKINPDSTRDGSMALGIEKASDEECAEYAAKQKQKKDQVMPESKQAVARLTEDMDEDEVVEDLVKAFGEEHREEIKDSLELGKGRWGDRGDAGIFKVDGTEYALIGDEDEAEKIAIERTKEDLESEPEIFNQDFIRNHLTMSDTDRRVIANEEGDARASDLRYDLEKGDFDSVFQTTNKFEEEYAELKEKMEAEEGDGDSAEAKKLYAEIEKLAEKAIEEFDEEETDRVYDKLSDPIEYFVNELGAYTIEDLMKQSFISIDTEAASEEAVRTDGWAHFLSLYDGNYETTPGGRVYFRED
jgi:cold shock CspA family protein